jgi:methyl-accepting chemotaxis protein
MRTNLPVTQNEVKLTDATLIVSKTDLQGRITYINRDFLEISGFTETELIGEPHNIVRHPDMPSEAFVDLWKTLKAGRPWIGLVKNRCKNGDFYWVEAHASPLREAGQVVGYMSVRKKASQSTIDATEQAYRMFRENRAGGKRIELGQVASGIGLGRKLGDMSLKAKLGGVMAILALLLLVVGIMGLSGMGQSNEGLRVVYEQRTMALADVTNINRLVTRNRGLVQDSLIDPVAGKVAANADAMQKNIAEITKIAEGYKARITDPEEKQRFERFATDRGQFVKEGLLATMELLKAGKLEDGRKVYTEKAAPLSAKVREHVDALRDLQLAGAKHEYEAALARYDLSRNLAIGLIVAGLLLALIASISLIRAITRPLDQAIEVFNKVGQGIYGNFIDTTRDDEIGKVLQSLESMQTKLGFDVAEAKRQADETLRIKIALDNVSTGVMIANGERTIIYANHAVKRVLKGAESEIKKQLPNFDAENMVGREHRQPSTRTRNTRRTCWRASPVRMLPIWKSAGATCG